jgi:HAE1 family hydrophobic/amphiphilic exporter-1
MTTFTLIAGMLPLALGTGPGAEERRATAIVVIGGQALCLMLTLIVTPVAYATFDTLRTRWRELVRRALRRDAPEPPGAAEALSGPSIS